MTEATAAPAKATIRPNIANMVKTKGGSYHKDDFIGTTLAGLTVDQVKVVAVEMGIDVEKYAHLNPGQIRMTLGNKLRAICADVSKEGLEGKALDDAIAANAASEEARDAVENLASAMKNDNEAAKIAADAEKAAAKAEKAAAKKAEKAAKKAKVGDAAAGEGDTTD